ncbi:hypothetical protein BH24CHL8_BH24CHL8_08070 [soil metagenome]
MTTFVDTNVLLYALDEDQGTRSPSEVASLAGVHSSTILDHIRAGNMIRIIQAPE